MSNQITNIPIGTNIAVLEGFALTANSKLGPIEILYENTGPNNALLLLQQFVPTGGTSGAYVPIGSSFSINRGGVVSKSYVILSQRFGLFGSGPTTISMTVTMRNPSNLAGNEFTLDYQGRTGWNNFDVAFDQAAYEPAWPAFNQLY